jgi:branched-chain amino acid transport system ATP-binding protein
MLTVTALSVRFGGVHAVRDVALRVERGQVVGLIGPNGAGKTTFVDAITGFVRSTGSVILDGGEINNLRPHQRTRRGLARSWQSLELFDDLTVGDNLAVAAANKSVVAIAKDFLRPARSTPGRWALDMLGISELANTRSSELSHGQRKLVSMARAMASRPKVLCIDEPAAGLDPSESVAVADVVRQIAASGVAVLVIDHDMSLMFSVCDYINVLNFGVLIAAGDPDIVRSHPSVVKAYLGALE